MNQENKPASPESTLRNPVTAWFRTEVGDDRFKWLVSALGQSWHLFIPPVVLVLTASFVSGKATIGYFSLVAQILPILILALAIELKYFAVRPLPPKPPSAPDDNWKIRIGNLFWYYAIWLVVVTYPAIILLVLTAGEAASLAVVGRGHSGPLEHSGVTAALACGAAALIVSVVFRSGFDGGPRRQAGD